MGRRASAGVLVLTVSLVLAASPASPASASCLALPSVEEGLAAADVVFVGTVVDLANQSRLATFAVEEIWKGEPGGARVEVQGGPAGEAVASSVDRTYQSGVRYLVFATGSGNPWEDNACSATRPYDQDAQRFRPASARPVDAKPASDEGGEGGVKSGTVVFAAVLLVVFVGGFLVVRRWGGNDGTRA